MSQVVRYVPGQLRYVSLWRIQDMHGKKPPLAPHLQRLMTFYLLSTSDAACECVVNRLVRVVNRLVRVVNRLVRVINRHPHALVRSTGWCVWSTGIHMRMQ